MNRTLKLILTAYFAFMLGISQSSFAQSLQEIQEYCQSMYGSDMNDDDARANIEDCINEQKSYLTEDSFSAQENYSADENNDSQEYAEPETIQQDYSSEYESYNEEVMQEPEYEQESYAPDTESQDRDCYSKVDEQIQKLLDNDPNSPFDYDQLIEQCLKGNF